MTTTEAIKQLQTEHDLIANEYELDGSQFAPVLLEALAMAIEALKAQDMTLYMNLPEVSAEEVVEILKRNTQIQLLPSAQPKPDKNPLPEQPNSDRLGVKTGETCTDTINRQDAIEVLRNRWLKTRNYDGIGEDIAEECEIYLKTLPSAQPKIILCKDCKWYGRADKRRFYRGMDCLKKRINAIVPDKDFCSRAERRTDE